MKTVLGNAINALRKSAGLARPARVAQSGPAMIKLVNVTKAFDSQVVLRNLHGKRVSVQPLDGAGCPLGGTIPAQQSERGWTFGLGEPTTTWFAVTVER